MSETQNNGPVATFDIPKFKTPQNNLKGLYGSSLTTALSPEMARVLGRFILDAYDENEDDNRAILAYGEQLMRYYEAWKSSRRNFHARQQDPIVEVVQTAEETVES